MAFDYFLKDHLGNTRAVVTDELQTDKYPVASLEPSKVATEKNYYSITDAQISLANTVSGLPAYNNDNGIGNNPDDATFAAANSDKLYRLNSNEAKTGLGMTLKVMAGDKVDVFGTSFYNQNTNGGAGNNGIPIIDLLEGLLNAPGGGVTGTHGAVTGTQLNTPGGTAGITNMFTEQASQSNANTSKPKAFINVIFFDSLSRYFGKQFKAVDFKVSMVGSNSELKNHYPDLQNLTVPKNGYVYIYCSNESPVNSLSRRKDGMYFDNIHSLPRTCFGVVHNRSALLEETHYYPFGLTMSGISSKAAGRLENKRKWNAGSELNTDFDINLYETRYRSLDPQIGRFWQLDTKPNPFESLYASMGNNPILKNDPLGDTAKFYNEQGVLIGQRADGSKRITPTIIGDDNLNTFSGLYNSGRKHFDNEADYVKAMQAVGTTYDTKSFSKFYSDNKSKYKAKFVKNDNIENASKIKVDGKPVNALYSEVTANTVLVNGVVTVGKNKPTTNYSLSGADPDKPGNEPNRSGNIHLHPYDRVVEIAYFVLPFWGGGTITGGKPSPGDHNEYDRSGKGTRFVVVDASNIILYNGNSNQTITIPRQ
jgi:RHS repeat-associated protein